MAVNIDRIIQINDQVIAPVASGLSQTMLLLTSNGRIPSTMPAITFENSNEVALFFGMDSDELKISKVYFKSFDRSDKKPNFISFGKLMNVDGYSWFAGNIPSSIEDFKAVSNGSFNINSINNLGEPTEYALTELDFSNNNSYSEIANSITQAMKIMKIENTTMIYDSSINRFVIENSTTGLNSKIISVTAGTEGTDISKMIAMLASDNPVISNGYIANTGYQNMDYILSYFKNFVSFSVVVNTDLNFQESLALWTNDASTRFVYFPYTTDSRALTNGDQTQIGFLTKSYSGVAPIFGTNIYAGLFGGIGASIDYDSIDGVITFALKKQSGLKTVIDNSRDYDNVIANGYNVYAIFGNVDSEFKFTQQGKINGSYIWIDAFYNQIWLRDQLTNSLASLLQNNKRIPYSAQGFQIVQTTIENQLSKGLNNGVIESRLPLDQDVIDKINIDAGRIITPILFENGYYVLINEFTQTQRTSRKLPRVDIWYTYAGAVQSMEIDLAQIQ